MKKIKKFFVLFTMLIAGLSFKGANNVDKNVVAGAADVVTDANQPVAGSYAYLKGMANQVESSVWPYMLMSEMQANGYSFSSSEIKNLLITNDRNKVPTSGYLNGCPVEVGVTGANYTPENYYTDGCAVAAYVYPNATDTTMYDCILFAEVETIYPTNGNSLFAKFAGAEKITFDCKFSMEKTTSMYRMFYQNENLLQIEGLTNLDTTNVTNMDRVFASCSALTTLDVSKFNTSNVTTMNSMFGWCNKLTTITGFENFKTSSVIDFGWMFYLSESITTLDVSHFDTSGAIRMDDMFAHCASLTSIKGLENFNTSNVEDMSEMFYCCRKLENINVGSFDTSNVTDMDSMFTFCSTLTSIEGIENFNTSKVTDMNEMFSSCSSLTKLDVSSFDTSNVTLMYSMFGFCKSLTTIKGLENFNTSKVTDMHKMFDYCQSLTSLDVSHFDTSKVTNMSRMFSNCTTLTSIEGLENFNTSNVTNMSEMFDGSKKLETIDVSSFDTSKVTNMSEMFAWCQGLTSIEGLENWDTSNVTNMKQMFYCCDSLTSLDLSSFDLGNVTDMEYFLDGASYLEQIIAPKNLNGNTLQLHVNFGMTEIDSTMEGWTLLKGSKEFNILYNTLLRINVCTEYAKASELQAMYDGLNEKEKDKLATLSDDGGVILTDKLSYMVSYADYKANESTKTAETHLVISPVTGQYLVIVIACLSLALIGGYYFIQKKKYAK